MRPFTYILLGVLFLSCIGLVGNALSLWRGGSGNSAQVLSVIVLPAPSGGGDTGGTNNGYGNSNSGSNNSGSSGAGAGGAGGAGAGAPAVAATPPTKQTCNGKGDINHDCKVDIIDFSILAYWYKRPLTAAALAEGVDLNGDGKVTLADFSILAYYWSK